jgi:hypothetical protein
VNIVLDQIAQLSLQLNKALPSARSFITERWENLINFEPPSPVTPSADTPWQEQMDELAKMERMETRIRDYIEGSRGFYSYLVPVWVNTKEQPGLLDTSLAQIIVRKNEIRERLKAWKGNDKLVEPQNPPFDPIYVEWPRIHVECHNPKVNADGWYSMDQMEIFGISAKTGMDGIQFLNVYHIYYAHRDTGFIKDIEVNSSSFNLPDGKGVVFRGLTFVGIGRSAEGFELVIVTDNGETVARVPLPPLPSP